jgi:hypothetical protein
MESGDYIKQKRDRILFNGKRATLQKAPNKTLQTDSQTLIDLARGGQRVFTGKQEVFPACCNGVEVSNT